eukprot:m.79703 g.79703  ORF g.79703 m.79703 type:complete len:180 (+) comp16284_c0_seq1:249-788(+)
MSSSSGSVLDAEVESGFNSLSTALDSMDDRLAPLLNTPLHELRAAMTPIESAKFDLGVAYTLNSLFWMYLCTQGISPHDHAVKSELGRIKDCMVRVQKIDSEAPGGENSNKSLNKAAAKRFISAALAGDSQSSQNPSKTEQHTSKRKSHEPDTTAEAQKEKQYKKSKKMKKKSSKKVKK